jgi:hypothetical protein
MPVGIFTVCVEQNVDVHERHRSSIRSINSA